MERSVPSGLDGSEFERLQGLLDSLIRGDVIGAILRVEPSGAGGRLAAGAGHPNKGSAETVDPESTFRIASVTKTFTAVVVLQLVEEGRLGLDDPVAGLVGDDVLARLAAASVPTDQLTVRRLLQHTSGCAYDPGSDPNFIAEVIAHPARRWQPLDLLTWAVGHMEQWATPGRAFSYCDTNYVILGLMIEHVTGHTLAAEYRRRVFTPLGMRSTYLEGHETPRGPALAHPFLGSLDAAPFNGSFDWGAGGLVSTAGDLSTFVRALFAGRLFTRASTLDAMTDTGSTGGAYGLGVARVRVGNAVLWGHSGFWGAFAYWWPERGLALTGTINQAMASPDPLLAGTVSIVSTNR
jgi:D-alanyl-D-alanine carboxypeptidase